MTKLDNITNIFSTSVITVQYIFSYITVVCVLGVES